MIICIKTKRVVEPYITLYTSKSLFDGNLNVYTLVENAWCVFWDYYNKILSVDTIFLLPHFSLLFM